MTVSFRSVSLAIIILVLLTGAISAGACAQGFLGDIREYITAGPAYDRLVWDDVGLPVDRGTTTVVSVPGYTFGQVNYGSYPDGDYIQVNVFLLNGKEIKEVKQIYETAKQGAVNIDSDGTIIDHKEAGDSFYYLVRSDKKTLEGIKGFTQESDICFMTWNLSGRSEGQVNEIVNRLEERARNIMFHKVKISYEHYPPFSEETGHRPGEVIFTLKDSNKKALANTDFYLLVERTHAADPGTTGDMQATVYESVVLQSPFFIKDTVQGCPGGDRIDSYYRLTTDEFGKATFNYLDYLDYTNLINQLYKYDRSTVRLWAVTFNKDPLQVNTGLWGNDYATATGTCVVEVQIDSIAIIRKIETRNDQTTIGVMVKNATSEHFVRPSMLPYKLRTNTILNTGSGLSGEVKRGDILLLDEDDVVYVEFLGGNKFKAWTRPGFITGEKPYAKLYIGYKDLGLYRWVQSNWVGKWKDRAIALGSTGVAFYFFGLPEPAEAAWIVGNEAFAGGFTYGENRWDPIAFEQYSEIFLDWDDNGATIYTVEGTAQLHGEGDTWVNVTTGQKIAVGGNDSPGPATPFKTDELRDDQKYIRRTTRNGNGIIAALLGLLPLEKLPCGSIAMLAGIALVVPGLLYRRKR